MTGKKIILIGGYCATGKSTFARILSNKTGIIYFDKDTIKEIYADSFNNAGDNVYNSLSAATFCVMHHIASRFFMVGQRLILESNFRPHECERINLLIEEYGYDCLTFLFYGDLPTLFDRYVSRGKTKQRHWVHWNPSSKEIYPLFEEGNKKLGEITPVGRVLSVDATRFEDVDYDGLIKVAKEFLGS